VVTPTVVSQSAVKGTVNGVTISTPSKAHLYATLLLPRNQASDELYPAIAVRPTASLTII